MSKGTKEHTIEFFSKITEFEKRFKAIGQEIIPELETNYSNITVAYDGWNYEETQLSRRAMWFTYNDIRFFFDYSTINASIAEDQIWLTIYPNDLESMFMDVFLCNYIDYKDGNWYVQSPINQNDPETSHSIVLTDDMIRNVFKILKETQNSENAGTIKVYSDKQVTDNNVLTGYKGKIINKSGIIYCPYKKPHWYNKLWNWFIHLFKKKHTVKELIEHQKTTEL